MQTPWAKPSEQSQIERRDSQLKLATEIVNWAEGKIQELKDEIRIKNQKILYLKLQIKNIKNDKSEEDKNIYQTSQI